MLNQIDRLPEGLLDTDSRGLAALLGGPTLLHLPGAREPALFVSVLLHGNETVGWDAVRGLLAERIARFGEPRLPRALALFIGNVQAAAAGLRALPGQPDYNRVWPGSELPRTREHDLMDAVVEIAASRGLFASLDLHNNTGANPHYGCVNRLDHRALQLATLFGRIVVYFLKPAGVQSMAMAALCPAVTLECGKVGETLGVLHARAMLDAALHLAEIPDRPVAPQDIDLFHTVARVRIPDRVDFGFPPGRETLLLNPEIERFNFRELPAGTVFGRLGPGPGPGTGPAAGSAGATGRPPELPVDVRDEQGRDVGARYFEIDTGGGDGGELRLVQPVMPSMLTLNRTVIRQDCLGYLMERYDDHVPRRD